jgi:hypothetical protein
MTGDFTQPPASGLARSFFTPVNVSQSDIRPHIRAELDTIRRQAGRALSRGLDRETTLHLEDVLKRIDEILNPND